MLILIKGIKLSDLDFCSIMERNMDYSQKKTIIIDIVEKLPRTYNTETWPLTTNIPCWSCREKFKHIPFPIITRWDKEIHIKGSFCSKECVKHYLVYYKDPDINQKEIKRYISMFIDFCDKKLGIKIDYIPDLEPFYMNSIYGY